jgi:pectate lyase
MGNIFEEEVVITSETARTSTPSTGLTGGTGVDGVKVEAMETASATVKTEEQTEDMEIVNVDGSASDMEPDSHQVALVAPPPLTMTSDHTHGLAAPPVANVGVDNAGAATPKITMKVCYICVYWFV